MINPLDFTYIAGDDRHNAEVDKRLQQQTDERRHQDTLREQREANDISKQALEEARKANRKSKRANVIAIVSIVVSALSVVATVLVSVLA